MGLLENHSRDTNTFFFGMNLTLVNYSSGQRGAIFNCMLTHSQVYLVSPRLLPQEWKECHCVCHWKTHCVCTHWIWDSSVYGLGRSRKDLQGWPYPGNVRAFTGCLSSVMVLLLGIWVFFLHFWDILPVFLQYLKFNVLHSVLFCFFLKSLSLWGSRMKMICEI